MKHTMQETYQSGGGIYGTLTVLGSWVFTFIASFSAVPLILSSILSVLGIVNYIILIRKHLKNKNGND